MFLCRKKRLHEYVYTRHFCQNICAHAQLGSVKYFDHKNTSVDNVFFENAHHVCVYRHAHHFHALQQILCLCTKAFIDNAWAVLHTYGLCLTSILLNNTSLTNISIWEVHFLTTVRFQLTLYQTKGKPALMKVELDLWYGYIAQAK